MSRGDLEWAAARGLLSPEQVGPLWEALRERGGARPGFTLAHVAYYAGALIVIAGMGVLMTLAWESSGGGTILAISLAYAACFALAGVVLWRRDDLRVLGGLLVTVSVCMAPPAVYGLQRWTGLWTGGDPGAYLGLYERIAGGRAPMELATVLAGLIALRRVRFAFLAAPIAVALWSLSMDLAPLLLGGGSDWGYRSPGSLWSGVALLIGSYLVDRRTREDYAFWGYLFGMLAFWGGLADWALDGGEGRYALVGLISVGLVLLSIVLSRRVFAVFGAFGVFAYLAHLSWEVFEDSLLFPFALTGVGVATIALAVAYQRNRERLERAVLRAVPEGVRRLAPRGPGDDYNRGAD